MADPSLLTGARLAVKAESVPGTLETTGTFVIIPMTTEGFSINPTKNFIDAEIVDATRQKTSTVGGAQSSRITINTFLNAEPGIRFLLESAFFSTFSTDTIKTGATRKTFSLELKNDLGTDVFRRVAGCVVDSMSLSFPEQGFIKASWNILGQAYSTAGTENGTAYTATSGYEGMASSLAGTSLTYNSSALPGVTDFNLTVSNGLIAMFAMASSAADHLTQGNTVVEGSGSYYLRDNTITTPFISEAADDLVIVAKSADASPILNTLTITMPKTKFTGAEVGLVQKTISDKFTFKADYDSGITSKLQFVYTAV